VRSDLDLVRTSDFHTAREGSAEHLVLRSASHTAAAAISASDGQGRIVIATITDAHRNRRADGSASARLPSSSWDATPVTRGLAAVRNESGAGPAAGTRIRSWLDRES
jgi:hypothetical protein